jgi:hypothetical protein
MAEERDGEHVSAEEQIVAARQALETHSDTGGQMTFEDIE